MLGSATGSARAEKELIILLQEHIVLQMAKLDFENHIN